MAKLDIRLPPDIIRAIEEVLSRGETAQVKYDRGVLKVQYSTVRLVKNQEI